MQSLHLSWEVLIYPQGILLDTPPGITLTSSMGAPSWFFLRTFSSLMAVPWLYILSGPALMNRLFWCHCKTGEKGSWSEETSEWNGLQQSSSVIFQPIRVHLFSVQTFPGMGSSLHQPILNLDGFQKEQLWRPIPEAWSATSTDFPFHPEEGGLWAWKRILRHHLLLHQLPGRPAEVRTEADPGSSVLAASNHCLWLE